MLPTSPLPDDARHVRVLLNERLSHQSPSVVLVEFISIAALHLHRRRLVAEERIEEHRAPAILKNAQREVGVLVIESSPTIRNVVPYEDARVDTRIERHRVDLTLTRRKHKILHPGERYIFISINEILGSAKCSARIDAYLEVSVQSVESVDIVVENPVALGAAFDRVFPYPVTRRYRPLA